ncbi:MAG TPA: ABC transporter substrate-binding protein [Janthinobacterium sp.]|nr:ABC transporter substrate-binding protein [Janthinobacterium sp.]
MLRVIPTLACLCASLLTPAYATQAEVAPADSLQVLHWWVSAGERRAVDILSTRLKADNIGWQNAVIPNGSGVGAGIVLRSRILAKNAPEVAQLNGIVLTEWAQLDLLMNLDRVAAAGNWNQLLLPAIEDLVQADGHFVAAPLGIHRVNTLFYNRRLFARYGLAPPTTWSEFEHAAIRLQEAGVVPLAQSSEPWQVATLFETLVLSEGGAALYRRLFIEREGGAFADARLGAALAHLRSLKKWMGAPVAERSWDATVRRLADGQAAMMVMGDWAKGELNAWGQVTDEDFGCTAVPGTASFHLYNVDTLAMLAMRAPYRAAQEKLAALVMTPAVQADYNQAKGSVSVLRAPDMSRMDSCARASWKLFSSGGAAQVPSLVHRMAADEIVRDGMVAEIHRFFLDDKVSVADTQRRLATIARSPVKSR